MKNLRKDESAGQRVRGYRDYRSNRVPVHATLSSNLFYDIPSRSTILIIESAMSNPPLTPPPPEYGTARKSLPPAGIVAICLAIVVAIAATYALTHRAHPLSSGSIDEVTAADVPGQEMVMVAINVSIQNNEDKPSQIKFIKVTADVGGSQLTDDAAPAVDAQRYLQAFPELKLHALDFLIPEATLNPGNKVSGTIVVSFPVKADAFAARKSLTVTVTPYDELPVVITK
jgi:hypothetical protein